MLTGLHQNFFPNWTNNSRLTGSNRSDGLKPRFFSMTQLLVLFDRRRWNIGVWFTFRSGSRLALCEGVLNERSIAKMLIVSLFLWEEKLPDATKKQEPIPGFGGWILLNLHDTMKSKKNSWHFFRAPILCVCEETSCPGYSRFPINIKRDERHTSASMWYRLRNNYLCPSASKRRSRRFLCDSGGKNSTISSTNASLFSVSDRYYLCYSEIGNL